MKRFYRLLCTLLIAGAVVATACSENGTDDAPKEVEFDSGTKDQTVYADTETETETANDINFTAKAAWTATVTALQTKAEGGSEVEWLTLDKYSGEAGKFSLKMSIQPNYTGKTRKAQIEIVCGDTSIRIIIEQKGTNKDGSKPLDDNGNIQFPDARFAAYMIDYFDENSDGGISPAEAAKITEIECNEMGIESLKGIEYCTNLTYLECDENRLTSLNISKNTKLTVLYCYYNQLKTLDASKNTELTDLDCGKNQLTSLDISKNPKLAILDCHKNQLKTLNVSNKKLIELYCEENPLTTLDVSMTNLGNSNSYYPLFCNTVSLKTLYLKTGWQLKGINYDRSTECIHPNTEIKYKD